VVEAAVRKSVKEGKHLAAVLAQGVGNAGAISWIGRGFPESAGIRVRSRRRRSPR
jgi:hypothetical protein